MLAEQNTKHTQLLAFHGDAVWWKRTLGYLESETRFLSKLLNAQIYRENVPNLFERLQNFKQELETNSRETKHLKKVITGYEEELIGVLEGRNSSHHNDYMEKHLAFKDRYEGCYIRFNDYKTRVLNYIGGML